jgi:PEP-CTERM motif
MAVSTRSATAAISIAAVSLIGLPYRGAAEPILVTGGFVQVDVSSGGARVSLSGQDFAAVFGSGFSFRSPLRLCPCPATEPLDLGGFFHVTSNQGGFATIDGVSYPDLVFSLGTDGLFTTPTTVVSTGPRVVTLPFAFTGSLAAWDTLDTATPPPLIDRQLVGSGTVRAGLNVFNTDSGPVVFASTIPGTDFQLEYLFSAPVPEPGTLLLLGTGAIVAAGVRRRRRSRRHAADRSIIVDRRADDIVSPF